MTDHWNNAVAREVSANLTRAQNAMRLAPSAAPEFDWAELIDGLCSGTFRKSNSETRRMVDEAEARYGAPPGSPLCSVKVPELAFRADTLGVAGTGGFLGGTNLVGYIPALGAYNPFLRLVTTQRVPAGSGQTLAKGAAQLTASWQAGEGAAVTDVTQTFGQIASSPKTLTVNVKLSRQLLKQSNARAIVPSELSRVVAVALGGGIVNGIGNAGQPTGILNAGITSAPGTSLAYGGIVTATQTVADANGVLDPANCAWITTPTVAGLLKNRFRNGTGSDPVWMGNIPLGTIEGAPAYATRLMPPGTALYGDFSGVTVFEYPSGALIEVDPFTGFQSGIYNVKLTLYVDVVVGYLPSFYSITSIT